MKRLLLSLSTLLLSITSSASILNPEGAGIRIENIHLASMATSTVEGEPLKLTSAGSGLRSKKIVFVDVKVYVAQLFVSNIEAFHNSQLESPAALKDQSAAAIQLHFLRDVDSEKVQESFTEALKANNINTGDSTIKQVLEAVRKSGEVKKGTTMTILGHRTKDGNEVISYESTRGIVTEVKGSPGLIEQIFSIWLGKPSDSGVAQLKKSLFKK